MADNEDLVQESNRLTAEVTHLLSGKPAGMAAGVDEPPDNVATIKEAINRASSLKGVLIQSKAPVDIEKLEERRELHSVGRQHLEGAPGP